MTEINQKLVNLDKQISCCLIKNKESLDSLLCAVRLISDDVPNELAIDFVDNLFCQWVNIHEVKKELFKASQLVSGLTFEVNTNNDVDEMVVAELWEAMKLDFDKSFIDEISIFSNGLVEARMQILCALKNQADPLNLTNELIYSCFLYAINWLEWRR